MNYQSKVAGDPASPEKPGPGGAIDRLFEVTRSGSTIRTEIIAALTTFLAASYVIVVNPAILQNAGIPFSGGVTATVLVSFIGSCAMGLYARSPILVAPGMGINALFAYTMVMGAKVPLEIALGCVFWAGVLFTILAILNLRTAVIEAVPKDLRYGIACGIGLFIALIGLENAKFIVASPDTIVALTQFTPVTLTFIAGFIITAALVVRRIPGAMMTGMIITTVLAIPIGRLWGDGSAFAGGTRMSRRSSTGAACLPRPISVSSAGSIFLVPFRSPMHRSSSSSSSPTSWRRCRLSWGSRKRPT